MNICMVVPLLVCSEEGVFSGGHTNSMLRLANGMFQANHKVYVIGGAPSQIFERLRNLNLTYVTLFPLQNKRKPHTVSYSLEFIMRAALLIKRLHKTEKLDLVHIHAGYPFYGLLSIITKWLCRLPFVYTLYCPVSCQLSSSIYPTSSIKLVHYSLSRIDRIIAISKNIRDSLLEIGILDNRIDMLPPPINLEISNSSYKIAKLKKRLGNTRPILLFVGNLNKQKGLEILLEAMPSVLTKYPVAKLIMALDAQEKRSVSELRKRKEIYKKIDQMGISANIVEKGLVKDLPSLMRASDVVVVPFLSTDGPADYPISILEAMSIGCPVVTTKVGGIAEFIKSGKNGILVNPNDPKVLAKNILILLDDPKLQKTLGNNAAHFIEGHFELHSVVSRVQEVYRKTIKLYQ